MILQTLELPRDLYRHDDAGVEWCYSGHLEGESGRFGFHLAFFRLQMGRESVCARIPFWWASPTEFYLRTSA